MATYPETMVQSEAIAKNKSGDLSRLHTEISVLDILAILAGHKRFVLHFLLVAAVLATVLAFVLPVRYEGKVVMLPPQQSSSIGSALLGQLGGSLGSLAPLASLAGGAVC